MITTINEFRRFISESAAHNTIVSVDIQPEYAKNIHFDISEWCEYINKAHESGRRIIFLYNGEEMGMIKEHEYFEWLAEAGIDESVIDSSTFYDKGYGFFRCAIDNGILVDDIIKLVKYMYHNQINSTVPEDFSSDQWNDFADENNLPIGKFIELFESGDYINIPDVMEFLNSFNSIELMGGDSNECLKEIEIIMYALDKDFEINNNFIF